MSHGTVIQACVCTAVAVGTAVALAWQVPRPGAPLPRLELYVDPSSAAEIRDLHAGMTDRADDWLRLADAYAVIGAYPEAEACYRRVSELTPDWPNAAYVWALSLERLGRCGDAIEQFRRALDLGHPAPERCWYRIGRNWLRLENADSAEAAFRRANDSPHALLDLAKLLLRSERPSEAIAITDELIGSDSDSVGPYLIRSRAFEMLGDHAASLADRERWEWSLNNQSPDAVAFQSRLRTRYGLEREVMRVSPGDPSRSERDAETLARSLDYRWDQDVLYQLADLVLERDPLRAERLLREHIEREGPSAKALERLGDVRQAQGDVRQCLALWQRAAGIQSNSRLQSKLERLYRARGDVRRADEHLVQSLHEDGVAQFRNRNLSEAERILSRATELDPHRAQTWFYLAEVRRHSGLPAGEAYERCITLDASHGRAIAALTLIRTSARTPVTAPRPGHGS